MRRPDFRTRLTAWYVVTAGAILAACGVAVDVLAARSLHEISDAHMRGEFDELLERVERAAAGGPAPHMHEPFLFRVTADAGGGAPQQEWASPHLPAGLLDDGSAGAPDGTVVVDTRGPPGPGAHRVMTARVTGGGRTWSVRMAGPLAHVAEELHAMRLVLLTVLPCGLAAGVAGGWWLAGRAMRPVRRMTGAALTISARNLRERLPVSSPDDELGRLAASLNTMLDRLAAAFEAERRFTADASHELLTPTAVMRTEIEVTLRQRRTPAEYEAVLTGLQEELARLTRLADGLLILAREDAGAADPDPEATTSIADVVRNVVESAGSAAEAAGLSLRVGELPAACVRGRPEHLRIVVGNLLDNAIKYTPPGGRVGVGVSAGDGVVSVAVEDTGPGIAAEDVPRVFERFFRVDKSRSRRLGGAGLGLSIARSIAVRLGGRIELDSRPGRGSTFRLVLPDARDARPQAEPSAVPSGEARQAPPATRRGPD